MQNVKASIVLAAKGFCMGTADIIPGVSGGTMAFILGIYPQLLRAIKSFDTEWLRAVIRFDLRAVWSRPDLGFLVPLACGIALAIAFFTRIIPLPVLLHTHPELVYGLFFGLIVGSILILLRQFGVPGALGWAGLGCGIALGWTVVSLIPSSTPETIGFVFLSGMLAICAMILPGISGSFILLILGKYAYVFDGLSRLDPLVIIPFALGAVTGLTLFTRLLTWILHTWRLMPIIVIIGFLIGSLWMVWPFQERQYVEIHGKLQLLTSTPVWPHTVTAQVIGSLALMIGGICAVLLIRRLARHRETAPSSGAQAGHDSVS